MQQRWLLSHVETGVSHKEPWSRQRVGQGLRPGGPARDLGHRARHKYPTS